ncbi:hypothetical protein IFR05_003350 [Cadophora sp. M221]|nr:hypothetical protein IFR05_003350 [Cadophora sp. M221]
MVEQHSAKPKKVPRSTPPFRSQTSAGFTEGSEVTSATVQERTSAETTYQSAAPSLSNKIQELPTDGSATGKTLEMATNTDKSSSKLLDVEGSSFVDGHNIASKPKDGVNLTSSMDMEITPTMQFALPTPGMPNNIRPQEIAQTSTVHRGTSEVQASSSSSRAISESLRVADQEQTLAVTQTRSQSAPPDVPNIPESQQEAPPSIPVSQQNGDVSLFDTGYNHEIFTEAAKRIGNEALEKFFDFKGYTRGNLEAGSKAKANNGDEMTKAGEDKANVQSTSETATPNISVEAASVIGEAAAKDGGVNSTDVEGNITAQNLDVGNSRSSDVKSTIEQGAKGDGDLTDRDVEMGGLDEVDQL